MYSSRGRHIGWFEGGVVFDSRNRALVFGSWTANLPRLPGLFGAPRLPHFGGVLCSRGFQVGPAGPVGAVGPATILRSTFKPDNEMAPKHTADPPMTLGNKRDLSGSRPTARAKNQLSWF